MDDVIDQIVGRLAERAGSTFFGKYRGVVTDVDDPLGQCRIRATVPALLGEHASGWALPAAPFAGAGHGFVMLPAAGSAVWIEFEAGNLDAPIWSGGWWGADERPDPQGAAIRVIASEHGHRLILDDEADEIRIEHGSGPSITLTADEIALTCGACTIRIGTDAITLNDGQIRIGLTGVSLADGAMSLGVAP